MALKYSVTVRNARLDAIETAIGTSAILKIRTGAPPANCATADSGTVLSTVNLPSDWLAAALVFRSMLETGSPRFSISRKLLIPSAVPRIQVSEAGLLWLT